jgi:hypothetical protein
LLPAKLTDTIAVKKAKIKAGLSKGYIGKLKKQAGKCKLLSEKILQCRVFTNLFSPHSRFRASPIGPPTGANLNQCLLLPGL